MTNKVDRSINERSLKQQDFMEQLKSSLMTLNNAFSPVLSAMRLELDIITDAEFQEAVRRMITEAAKPIAVKETV
jgi:hypothetical protein